MRLVLPSDETPTDTITDFENVGRVRRSRRAATFFLMTPADSLQAIVVGVCWHRYGEDVFISEPDEVHHAG